MRGLRTFAWLSETEACVKLFRPVHGKDLHTVLGGRRVAIVMELSKTVHNPIVVGGGGMFWLLSGTKYDKCCPPICLKGMILQMPLRSSVCFVQKRADGGIALHCEAVRPPKLFHYSPPKWPLSPRRPKTHPHTTPLLSMDSILFT